MPRALKLLAIVVLVAVLPLRAVAGVTIGFCASGHKETAAAHSSAHGHQSDAHAHQGDDAPVQPVESSCNICAEHCSSAAFAPALDAMIEPQLVAQERTTLDERSVTAFIPDQLDRPPLA